MTEQHPMPVVDHLEELRRRLLIILTLFIPLAGVGFWISSDILSLLSQTTGPLVFLGPADALTIRLKVALSFAIIFSIPVVSYQFWMFIAPAFSPAARRWVAPGVIASIILFWAGVAVGYFILPAAMAILLSFSGPGLQPMLTAPETLNFIVMMLLFFGLAFEFPLVLIILLAVGVISQAMLRKYRAYAVLGILIISAIITPTQDVITLAVMAVPLILFYETVILLAPWVERK